MKNSIHPDSSKSASWDRKPWSKAADVYIEIPSEEEIANENTSDTKKKNLDNVIDAKSVIKYVRRQIRRQVFTI